MVHLTLAGLSEDGTRLLLVDDAGAEFTLDADARLRAALRGDHTRLGQLEITMDSALRPKDIQMRIRAGESAEEVAAAAQTTVEKIMPFAAPVLAEREHIAGRAQRASVRRRSDAAGSTGTARTLGEAVAAHLHSKNVPADVVSWDSYRREDGRWTVTGDFAAGKHKGTARFSFDAPGNFVTADNDDARWLLGEAPEPAPRARSPRSAGTGDQEKGSPRQRRLSAVPAGEALPFDGELGDDAIEMVSDETAPEGGPDRGSDDAPARGSAGEAAQPEAAPDAARRRASTPRRTEDEGSFLDAVFARSERDRRVDAAAAVDDGEDDPDEPTARDGDADEDTGADAGGDTGATTAGGPDASVADEPAGDTPEARPAKESVEGKPTRPRKKGRASVPSWDEIMFGGNPE